MSAEKQPSKKSGRPASRRVAPGWRLVGAELAAGQIVAGIDEVGRGAWAGPVTAAAVILRPRARLDGLADSKLLTAGARRDLDRRIRRVALAVGVGWVGVEELNANGLGWAVKQSGLRALADMSASCDRVILDGSHNYLRDEPEIDSVAYVKADLKVAPVAAASIVAKVARDNYLIRMAARYAEYGFDGHKGYPSPRHLAALREFGPCAAHRTSWRPFDKLREAGFDGFGEFATAGDYDAWLDELDAATHGAGDAA